MPSKTPSSLILMKMVLKFYIKGKNLKSIRRNRGIGHIGEEQDEKSFYKTGFDNFADGLLSFAKSSGGNIDIEPFHLAGILENNFHGLQRYAVDRCFKNSL